MNSYLDYYTEQCLEYTEDQKKYYKECIVNIDKESLDFLDHLFKLAWKEGYSQAEFDSWNADPV